MARAQLAVAHSIPVSAYWMLTRDQPHSDLGPDWLARRNDEAHARRLVAQLERLGHTRGPRPGRLTQLQRNWRTGFARPACRAPATHRFTGL